MPFAQVRRGQSVFGDRPFLELATLELFELTLNADTARGEIDVPSPERCSSSEPQTSPGCEKHQRPIVGIDDVCTVRQGRRQIWLGAQATI